jgi:hypothetical protein
MSSEKSYINTTITNYLLRSLKVLAAKRGLRVNQLLEEAIIDLLNKHHEKPTK